MTQLAIMIEPGAETAYVMRVNGNADCELSRILGGLVEAVEVRGGVMWINESGKVDGLPTNLLATKVAHRLHAGLYPDDTINGRALLLGETHDEHGEIASADVTPEMWRALAAVGVEVVAQASEEVLIVAGGSYKASLNHSNAGGNCMVTTVQVDDSVYVVGQDDYTIGVYSTAMWLGDDEESEPDLIEAETADDAWAILQHLRADHLLHQCADCDGWLYASETDLVGRLRCGSCGYTP